jgi:lipid-binding SYLF domain-containing protein
MMRNLRLLTAVLLAGGLVTGPALARHHHHAATVAMNTQQNVDQQNVNANNAANLSNAANVNTTNANNGATLADADRLLQNASGVITNMQSDTNVVNLLSRAKGVFIIPNSGSVSSGGVLLTSKNGRWSNPVFFSMGGTAPGVQPTANTGNVTAGTVSNGNSGPVALLIMSNRAMSRFESNGSFSIAPSARLNIVNFSANATQTSQAPQASQKPQPSQASGKTGDIIVWSGSNAANNGVTPTFTQVTANRMYDQTIYGTANMRQILAGRAPLTNQLAVNLSTEMPANQPGTRVGTREMTTRPG